MKALKKALMELIEYAIHFQLDQQDVVNAKEYVENLEYGLAFDTIVTQMYEYDIEINRDYYFLIEGIAKKMSLPNESYSFMKELIRENNEIPLAVKTTLAKIVFDLSADN